MAITSYFDLNSLATLPLFTDGVDGSLYYNSGTPYQPSVIDQRWPAPHEQFQPLPPPPTFNQRWPGPTEQFQNMDFPNFEGPGENFESFFRQDYASLSPFTPPGGMRDLGIDPLTSPFAPSPVQDLNPHSFLGGRAGPYGGTDPRFFGGGVNMSGWNEPDFGLTPQQHIDHRFPTPWEINTFMSGNDPGRFDHAFNQFPSASGPSFNDWTRMTGGGFPDGNMLTSMGSVGGGGAPFDDPRGDYIGATGSPGSFPIQPGNISHTVQYPVLYTPPPPLFTGGIGPGGIPYAPGLTPQGYIPPLPNYTIPSSFLGL